MAVIDRAALLADVLIVIPSENLLSDSSISSIIDNVVDNVIPEDDDIYYNNAFCQTLKRVGYANSSLASVSGGAKKREKVGQVEVEYFDSSTSGWMDYIDSLKNYCPMVLGVPFNEGGSGIGMQISPGDRLKVSPTDTDSSVETIYSDEWENNINDEGF